MIIWYGCVRPDGRECPVCRCVSFVRGYGCKVCDYLVREIELEQTGTDDEGAA